MRSTIGPKSFKDAFRYSRGLCHSFFTGWCQPAVFYAAHEFFLSAGGQTANYILTGSWSEKALAEAERFGRIKVGGASSKAAKYNHIPPPGSVQIDGDEAYVHLTSNNTIYGTQWAEFPNTDRVPLVADMSSDILSKPLAVGQFALIYAGAQKNLGGPPVSPL